MTFSATSSLPSAPTPAGTVTSTINPTDVAMGVTTTSTMNPTDAASASGTGTWPTGNASPTLLPYTGAAAREGAQEVGYVVAMGLAGVLGTTAFLL